MVKTSQEKETEALYKFIVEKLTKSNIKIVKNNLSRHAFHLRAALGDNAEEILNAIHSCEISSSSISLTATYNTQLIIARKPGKGFKKGTKLLLVNNGKPKNGILKTKQLTPDALKFAGNTYTPKQLYNELVKTLEKLPVSIQKLASDLIESADKNKTKIDSRGVTPADIKILAKDFGEMTGALWCMKWYFKTSESVTFPKASNAVLVDYYLTTKNKRIIYISAKAGVGAAPSLTAVSALINEKLVQPVKNEKKVSEFITDVKKLSGIDAILVFSKRFKTPGYRALEKTGANIKTHQQFEKQISQMSYEEVKSQFAEVYKVMNRAPNEKNAQKLFNTNMKKAGIILSPLGYHLIDELNKKKNFTDFLNKALNSLNTQQLYLDIGKTKIKYTMKEFKQSKFLYHFDSNIKKPDNKKISFKMKK